MPEHQGSTVLLSEMIPSVMVVRVKRPVWLHTHKAQPGEVVTVDPDLARKLIDTGTAEDVVAD